MFITNWGDETAIYQVNYQAASKLVSFDPVAISTVSAALPADTAQHHRQRARRIAGPLTAFAMGRSTGTGRCAKIAAKRHPGTALYNRQE